MPGWSVSAIRTLLLSLLVPVVIRAEQLPIRTYTTADGLAGNAVSQIVRDSRGFLWFATPEGLSRFDDYRFTTYGVDQGLPSRLVTSLLETTSGVLWVATYGGLCRFNPSATASRFTVYYPANPEKRERSRSSMRMTLTDCGAAHGRDCTGWKRPRTNG